MDLGANATIATSQSCLWDPPTGYNYPALIAKGASGANVDLKSSNATLKEGSQPKFNYNPPSDPYDGVSNTVENDQFPPLYRGLFHVIGTGTTSKLNTNLTIDGVYITEGTGILGANLTINRNPSIFASPPVGYTTSSGDPQAVPQTWRVDARP